MPVEQKQFLAGVNGKDHRAWEKLYDYFYAPLCCYAGRITGDESGVEDIVQGCLVKLWRSSMTFSDIKVITSYLYRSVYHASLNYIRDRQRARRIHEDWMRERVEEHAVEWAVEEEAVSRFYVLLEQLPEQQKEIILCCMKGDKVREIAEKLGISENSVKTQKKRAYQFLRERMGKTWTVVAVLLGIPGVC